MSPSNESGANSAQTSSSDADLAQAYRDLTRGEQTATALEANLSNLESKLDAILAVLEANESEQSKTSGSDKAKRQPMTDKGPVKDVEPEKTA
ncbi:hypothetical protein B0J13DRAFT_19242 [Dactylonectria estremocensis]|uniref:Uncharacterized protein n=1 Tax=Dactylonectria estremocensis TaxID=1079267 RepID=A0A9P9FHE6_9HYPO|nr:hypothetical protein B0J13DRAFT_19242 [Dactylonectria estremocensis]